LQRRVVKQAYLDLDGQRIRGLPLFDGGETGSVVVAPLTSMADAEGLRVVEFSAYGLTSRNQALLDARYSDRSPGIVAISADPGIHPGLAVLNAEQFTSPFGPPVLQVGSEYRTQLHEAAGAGRQGRLQIRFRSENTRAFNVGVRLEGRQPTMAPVVVMTPRSGWWVSTSERGGGIVVWLEAIREFVERPPLRPIIFTANTGHELGHIGLKTFLDENRALVRDAHVWVHLGANFAARRSEVVLQASSDALLDTALATFGRGEVTPEHVLPPEARPFGEAREIFDGGGRFVSLLGSNPLFHHPDDRWPDAVDINRTDSTTDVMVSVIRALADAQS